MGEVLDRKALWSISYGVYIVTSFLGDKLNGQIANTAIQVCADPPRIAVAINKGNLTHEYIAKSGVFGISILEEAAPMSFIGFFGFKSGREIDKLSQVNYKKGITGAPLVLDNAVSVMEAKVLGTADAGTHTIFIGDVVSAEVIKQATPLTYAVYQEVKKGKAPKTAPTYKGSETDKEKESPKPEAKGGTMKKYVCSVCGYVYDPEKGDPEGKIPPGTPFEKLPDDWTCPVCGASKDQFSPE